MRRRYYSYSYLLDALAADAAGEVVPVKERDAVEVAQGGRSGGQPAHACKGERVL